jgi:hypothetical protein
MKKVLALTFVLSVVAPFQLSAWGEKGHLISNEAATLALPSEMPAFFVNAAPELIYLSSDPDRWRGAGEAIEAVNAPDHYIDFEYVAGLELPHDRYKYLKLLETSRVLRKHGLSNASIGFLPWRIAEMSELLTQQWRLWRAAAPGDRRFIEHAVVNAAGVLAHYVGDAANPDHTTLNNNGWVLANPNSYPIDCDSHWRFETAFVSHAVVTADVMPFLGAPVLRTDYFQAGLDLIRGSHERVEELYRLDRDGAFRYPPVSEAGKRFTAQRLAAGATLIRDLWWSAYLNSAAPKQRARAR